MDDSLRQFVRSRADRRCEYCQLPQHDAISVCFHVEYIRARQHRGSDDPDNLAFACQQCNLHKGPNQSAYDPLTGVLVNLFHPRTDQWYDRFKLNGPLIIGLTPVGRATVDLLNMNSSDYIELREFLNDSFDDN